MSASESVGHPEWTTILVDAIEKPGVISEAYSRFWNYSTGNQLLAMFQCALRGLPVGPIHTFQGWKGVGRTVKKGERAITLCMPVTVKQKPKSAEIITGNQAERPQHAYTVFIYRPRWFFLSQTEGTDYVPQELPAWSESHALYRLGIKRVTFTHPNGNTQGYAMERCVAVSPIAALPHKTLFHEVAHVLLGHTEELQKLDDHDLTPRNLREVEAESVALICCESLNLPGSAECRGYIQHWLRGESIPERSAQRIFHAADLVLRSGRPQPASLAEPHD